MTVSNGINLDERDIVYLNRRENMEDGKTAIWLKYATTVLETQNFDCIGKTDHADTHSSSIQSAFSGNLPKIPDNIRVFCGLYRIN